MVRKYKHRVGYKKNKRIAARKKIGGAYKHRYKFHKQRFDETNIYNTGESRFSVLRSRKRKVHGVKNIKNRIKTNKRYYGITKYQDKRKKRVYTDTPSGHVKIHRLKKYIPHRANKKIKNPYGLIQKPVKF